LYAPKERVLLDRLSIGGAFVLVCLFIVCEHLWRRI